MPVDLLQSGGGSGGTTLTGTGIARNTGVCTELSGDVTTSGSNAASVVKVNGAAVPASQAFVGTNSSNQVVAATAGALPSGTTATTQAAGDNSAKVATTAYVDAPIDVAGMAGFFGGLGVLGPSGITMTTGTGFSATTAMFLAFYLAKPITIRKATLNVSAVSASGSKQFSFGIYPATAGSSVLASAALNVSTGQATGGRSVALTQGTVTLPAGHYYYTFTGNATDAGFAFFQAPAVAGLTFLNVNGTRTGSFTPATPGTIDATLPALTKNTTLSGNFLGCFFES